MAGDSARPEAVARKLGKVRHACSVVGGQMKRNLAWIGAIFSGLYLITIGPLPFPAMDPLPFIDEAVALAILLKCTSYLGYDLRKWLPFFGKNDKSKPAHKPDPEKDVTIDV